MKSSHRTPGNPETPASGCSGRRSEEKLSFKSSLEKSCPPSSWLSLNKLNLKGSSLVARDGGWETAREEVRLWLRGFKRRSCRSLCSLQTTLGTLTSIPAVNINQYYLSRVCHNINWFQFITYRKLNEKNQIPSLDNLYWRSEMIIEIIFIYSF